MTEQTLMCAKKKNKVNMENINMIKDCETMQQLEKLLQMRRSFEGRSLYRGSDCGIKCEVNMLLTNPLCLMTLHLSLE